MSTSCATSLFSTVNSIALAYGIIVAKSRTLLLIPRTNIGRYFILRKSIYFAVFQISTYTEKHVAFPTNQN